MQILSRFNNLTSIPLLRGLPGSLLDSSYFSICAQVIASSVVPASLLFQGSASCVDPVPRAPIVVSRRKADRSKRWYAHALRYPALLDVSAFRHCLPMPASYSRSSRTSMAALKLTSASAHRRAYVSRVRPRRSKLDRSRDRRCRCNRERCLYPPHKLM